MHFILSGFNLSIDFTSLLLIFALACCEIGYLIFYMKAIAKNDSSIINALFQFIPIITYVLGLAFLNEKYTITQIISGLIIMFSTIIIGVKLDDTKKIDKNKLLSLLFMIIAGFIISLQNLGFKVSLFENNFNTTMFYFNLFLLVLGLASLFLKSFKVGFKDLVKNNGKKVLFFNMINEVLNSVANMFKVYALALAPIAFVNAFGISVQIIIAFLMGIVLTILKPKLFNEDISKRTIIKKSICIAIAVIASMFFF